MLHFHTRNLDRFSPGVSDFSHTHSWSPPGIIEKEGLLCPNLFIEYLTSSSLKSFYLHLIWYPLWSSLPKPFFPSAVKQWELTFRRTGDFDVVHFSMKNSASISHWYMYMICISCCWHTQLILNSFTTNFALRSPDVETLEENKEDGVSAVYVCERFVEIDVHRRHTSILFKGRIYFVSFLDIPQYSIFYPLALLIILLKFIPGSSIDFI